MAGGIIRFVFCLENETKLKKSENENYWPEMEWRLACYVNADWLGGLKR